MEISITLKKNLNQTNKNVRDRNGNTPIMPACLSTATWNTCNATEIVMGLGVDIDAVDYYDDTLLHYSWAACNEEALRMLFKHSAQTCLTVRNNRGYVPSQIFQRLRGYDEKYGRPFQRSFRK
jgi:ankyrin repeat protein